MKIIGRILICIWVLFFICFWFVGGMILIPLFTYIITGECDDPFEASINVLEGVINKITKTFDKLHDNLHISNLKFDGGFWQ